MTGELGLGFSADRRIAKSPILSPLSNNGHKISQVCLSFTGGMALSGMSG